MGALCADNDCHGSQRHDTFPKFARADPSVASAGYSALLRKVLWGWHKLVLPSALCGTFAQGKKKLGVCTRCGGASPSHPGVTEEEHRLMSAVASWAELGF